MPVRDARRVIDDLGRSPAFEQTFEHTRAPFSGKDIAVPVTVAFGDRDWILPKGSRWTNELPAHTRWVEKHGWGHVPMWVDPIGVSQLILAGTVSTHSGNDRHRLWSSGVGDDGAQEAQRPVRIRSTDFIETKPHLLVSVARSRAKGANTRSQSARRPMIRRRDGTMAVR